MKTKIERLLKLADHLESKNRHHKRFNFSILTSGKWIGETYCGTSGCAMGELPIVFPFHFKFENRYIPTVVYIPSPWNFITIGVARFFGINSCQVKHLFYPNSQLTDAFGGARLGEHASAKQVAKNIRAFVKKVYGKTKAS